jgi:hypothetical protein
MACFIGHDFLLFKGVFKLFDFDLQLFLGLFLILKLFFKFGIVSFKLFILRANILKVLILSFKLLDKLWIFVLHTLIDIDDLVFDLWLFEQNLLGKLLDGWKWAEIRS